MVAADEIDRKLLVGECKWRNSLNETETLSTLQDRRRMLPGYNAYEHYESGGRGEGLGPWINDVRFIRIKLLFRRLQSLLKEEAAGIEADKGD
ncbi:hypothetical protein [Paratractidigestivibacter sp.]|uniref:hypothetical protein n=1 Tax=Paratractidigestivibacter sp. TaxID=2847316 RepID=UPI003AB3425A